MEPKQNYLVVGFFVIISALALAGFLLWLSGMDKRSYDTYQTFVSESVNGLSVGSPVKYRGVDVGKVTVIEISRRNPSKIHLMMDIADNTPITVGTVAVLQLQGITGLAYIELKGTVANAEPIPKIKDNKFPVIPSARSEFRQIVDTVPAMLEKFTQLANKLGEFASNENKQKFDHILTNLEGFSNAVGGKNEEGQSLITELQKATVEMGKAAASINDIASSSREDTQRILKSTAETLDKISKLTDNTTTMTQKGYADLHSLLLDVKKATRDIQALSRNLKENPSQIIIPEKRGGVTVPQGE